MILPNNNQNKKAKKKILRGILLMMIGAVGTVLGKVLRINKMLRILILTLSLGSFGVGYYLTVSGISDLALGRVGTYQLGTPESIQSMVYEDDKTFLAGLLQTKSNLPDLRRLRFECPDHSSKFTVYFTSLGVFGVPETDVICSNGFRLLGYSEKT